MVWDGVGGFACWFMFRESTPMAHDRYTDLIHDSGSGNG